MRKSMLSVKVMLVIMAVLAMISQAAIVQADLGVQVIKQNGKDVYIVKPQVDSKDGGPDQATTLIKQYSPSFYYYDDFNEPADNVYDIFACGENQTTGQITCKTTDTMTGTVMSTINFFDPSYNMPPNNTYILDIDGDGTLDVMACGIKLSDNSVACQTKKVLTGANVGVGTFTAIPAAEGMFYPDGYRWNWIEANNDSSSKEFAFCYRKSSTQQIVCRVVNIITGAVVSTIPIQNKNFDARTWTPSFTDRNSDGIYEVIACSKNHATGQYVCQIRNSATGALIKDVQMMTPTDYVYAVSYWYNYDQATPVSEFLGCGWNMATKQPKCEIKRQNNTVFKNFNVLGPAFIP